MTLKVGISNPNREAKIYLITRGYKKVMYNKRPSGWIKQTTVETTFVKKINKFILLKREVCYSCVQGAHCLVGKSFAEVN